MYKVKEPHLCLPLPHFLDHTYTPSHGACRDPLFRYTTVSHISDHDCPSPCSHCMDSLPASVLPPIARPSLTVTIPGCGVREYPLPWVGSRGVVCSQDAIRTHLPYTHPWGIQSQSPQTQEGYLVGKGCPGKVCPEKSRHKGESDMLIRRDCVGDT